MFRMLNIFGSIDIVVKPDVSSALGLPATFPWRATLWRTANQSEQTSRPVKLLEGAVRTDKLMGAHWLVAG